MRQKPQEEQKTASAAQEPQLSSEESDGEIMAIPPTNANDYNGSQLSQSMNSNTDIVRIDDGSSVGGGTNTSMASLGMAGIGDSQRSHTKVEEAFSDEESDEPKRMESQQQQNLATGMIAIPEEEETVEVIMPTGPPAAKRGSNTSNKEPIQPIEEVSVNQEESQRQSSALQRMAQASSARQSTEGQIPVFESDQMDIAKSYDNVPVHQEPASSPRQQEQDFEEAGDKEVHSPAQNQDSAQRHQPKSEKKLISELEQCAEKGEIGVNDSVLFSTAMLRPDEERLKNIFVGDPVERNGKIFYVVESFDVKGDFRIDRRFADFEALRKTFVSRLPGLYVPKLPKGSFFGESKDLKFLQERAFHLERFMKKIAQLPYLMQSGEFEVFTRPDLDLRDEKGRVWDVTKQLENLPEQSIEGLSFRMKSITNFDQRARELTSKAMEQMSSTIVNTQIFLRSHERFLIELIELIRGFMKQKDSYLLKDMYVAEFMEKYEHHNLAGYNSGGYAYRESKKIFARAEEDQMLKAAGTSDISSIAESIRVRGSCSALAKPSLMDKIKKGIGMRVEQAAQEEQPKKNQEIEMLDAAGHIQYRNLNTALIKKYNNPFRLLYLWAVQESLEVQSILEGIKHKEELEDRRRRLMRKVKMTQQDLDLLKPSRNGDVKDMFDQQNESTMSKSNSAANVDIQRDIVELVRINEMVTSFMAEDIFPRFKEERVTNYKKILAQFSKMERMNSKHIILMWQSIMHFHSEKGDQDEIQNVDQQRPPSNQAAAFAQEQVSLNQ